MRKILLNLLPVLLLSLAFSACVRERDTDTSLASQLALHAFVYHDASDLADDAATKNTGELLSNYKTRGYCASITHDKVNGHIEIDFGQANCMCNDGRYRKGKIIVDYTGNYSDSGSVHTLSFENYYVDNNLIMGTNIVENLGHNDSAQTCYSSVVEGKVLKPTVNDTLYYSARHTITWTEGESTPVWGDDVYEISGTANGKNENKTYYSMAIIKPLVKEVVGCRYFNKGYIEMQPQGKAMRSIDFGDGHCDNDATVTINNKTFHIVL
jgi:hypothetical protein